MGYVGTQRPVAGLPTFSRARLSRLISDAIDLLDAMDGDPDLEDDGDVDPTDQWGDLGDGSILAPMPVYGLDQSLGPINIVQALEAYMQQQGL